MRGAAAALAFRRIGRVGNLLQLAQNKLGNDQRAGKKTCLRNIRNPAVDITEVSRILSRARCLFGKDSTKGGKFQIVAFSGANHQPDVRHEKRQRESDECLHLGRHPIDS